MHNHVNCVLYPMKTLLSFLFYKNKKNNFYYFKNIEQNELENKELT